LLLHGYLTLKSVHVIVAARHSVGIHHFGNLKMPTFFSA
jgi:hypothetical protein